MNTLILTPKVSEKAIYLAERGQYIFEVPTSTNKIEIAKAVTSQFKVSVTSVNIVIHKGKVKRFKQVLGQEKDSKKAIVTLKKGQTIALFEGSK